MKRLSLSFYSLLFTMAIGSVAMAQNLPMPSPGAEVEQSIGLTKVEVSYSRPSMKGRTIFGDLVPFGEIWRTGANKCTTIEIEDAVTINGMEVAAGTYSMFTIPGKDEWMVIINKNTELWGAGGYNQEEDVMRFSVKPVSLPTAVESFTIGFTQITMGSAHLTISWDKTSISFPIEHDYVDMAIANIKEELAKEDVAFGAYEGAAEFYLDHKLDGKQALEWAKKSVEMKEVFWNVYTLSMVLKYNNMDEQALKAAKRSLELSETAEYKTYIDRNKKNIESWSK